MLEEHILLSLPTEEDLPDCDEKPVDNELQLLARAVLTALIAQKGYTDAELPSRQTIGAVLNRLGYRLKKHKRQNP